MNTTSTPSPSAFMSMAARAAHAIVDTPPLLMVDDTAALLCRSVGRPSPLDFHIAHPDERVLAAARLSAVARSAYAESMLRASGIHQYVVLGAGLDTSASRAPEYCDVWHVDLPGVLVWRSELLEAAGAAARGVHVPVDLTAADPIPELIRAGLRTDEPTFVSWLGVSMYLEPSTVEGTFRCLGALAPGSQLVFDHVVPAAGRDEAGAEYARAVGAATGAAGEPWRCASTDVQLESWLAAAGWSSVESVREADSVPTGFWERTDSLRPMKLVTFTHARIA